MRFRRESCARELSRFDISRVQIGEARRAISPMVVGGKFVFSIRVFGNLNSEPPVVIECRGIERTGNIELWSFLLFPVSAFSRKKFNNRGREYRARLDGAKAQITENSSVCDHGATLGCRRK